METPLKTIAYKNHTIKLYPDSDPQNPRDDDNIGTMICFHSRYSLGDKHTYSSSQDAIEHLQDDFGPSPIVLPLYLYDHSGITMSTSPFSCQWDSGQVGIIVCSRKKAIQSFGKKLFTKIVDKKVRSCLVEEVKAYDNYLTGSLVGFIIENKRSENIDSCWGFDDTDYAISEAKSIVDYLQIAAIKKRITQVKTFIKNHVPLDVRYSLLQKG
jgi:hypothetical protein